MPTLTTYLAYAPLDVVQPLVSQVFTEAGWQVVSSPAGTSPQAVRLSARRGSRLRTLLLGGGAGESFYLHHRLLLTPVAEPSAGLPLLAPARPGTSPEPGTAEASADAPEPASTAAATSTGTRASGATENPPATRNPAAPGSAVTATITRIDYPTSGAQAITRGGIYGAERESRSHDQLSQQIAVVLREAGIKVGSL